MKRKAVFIYLMFTLVSIGVYAQSVDLNTGIKNGAAYFEQNLQSGSTVAVLSIRSDSLTLSEFIIDELSSYLVNGRTFTVVDRGNIDLIQREMNYQLSGEVSDETAQSIGKRIGAETVITGAIQPFGDDYRLDLRALSVETGVIQGVLRQDIIIDRRLASLVEGVVAVPSTEAWKNNWLYLGFRAGGGFVPPALCFGDIISTANFHGSFSFTGQIVEWFGLQTEILFSYDMENFSREYREYKQGLGLVTTYVLNGTSSHGTLIVPLLARFTFRPSKFSFGAIAGTYFSFPVIKGYEGGTAVPVDTSLQSGKYSLEHTYKNSNGGAMAGVNFGYHIGPGTLFFDIRAFIDFNLTEYESEGAITSPIYSNYDSGDWIRKGSFNFSIGYEVGLIPKVRR